MSLDGSANNQIYLFKRAVGFWGRYIVTNFKVCKIYLRNALKYFAAI